MEHNGRRRRTVQYDETRRRQRKRPCDGGRSVGILKKEVVGLKKNLTKKNQEIKT